jgi:hypothetical protein
MGFDMSIMRAMIGIVFVAMTASSCVIGGDEPWDNNAGGDTDSDGDADTDVDSDTDTGPDGDTDGDGDSDDDVGLEAAGDGLIYIMPDAGGVDGGKERPIDCSSAAGI